MTVSSQSLSIFISTFSGSFPFPQCRLVPSFSCNSCIVLSLTVSEHKICLLLISGPVLLGTPSSRQSLSLPTSFSSTCKFYWYSATLNIPLCCTPFLKVVYCVHNSPTYVYVLSKNSKPGPSFFKYNPFISELIYSKHQNL